MARLLHEFEILPPETQDPDVAVPEVLVVGGVYDGVEGTVGVSKLNDYHVHDL